MDNPWHVSYGRGHLRKGLDRKWMEERSVLGMLVRARTVLTVFIRVRGEHEDGREEAQSGTHLGKMGETLIWTSLRHS